MCVMFTCATRCPSAPISTGLLPRAPLAVRPPFLHPHLPCAPVLLPNLSRPISLLSAAHTHDEQIDTLDNNSCGCLELNFFFFPPVSLSDEEHRQQTASQLTTGIDWRSHLGSVVAALWSLTLPSTLFPTRSIALHIKTWRA